MFNFRYFGTVMSLLKFLIEFYCQQRQHSYLVQQEPAVIFSDERFQEFCSPHMTLLNYKKIYPKCPKKLRSKFFDYEMAICRSEIGLFCFTVCSLSNILVFGTILYPILVSSLKLPRVRCFDLFIFIYVVRFSRAALVALYYSVFISPRAQLYSKKENSEYKFSSLMFVTIVECILFQQMLQFSALFMKWLRTAPIYYFIAIPTVYFLWFLLSSNLAYYSYEGVPLPLSDLDEDLSPLADFLGFERDNIIIVEESKSCDSENAMQVGAFGNYRIFILETVAMKYKIEQIKGVLAHEIGHWYFSHSNNMYIETTLDCFLDVLFSYIYIIYKPQIEASFFYVSNMDMMRDAPLYEQLEFSYIFGCFPLIFNFMSNIISNKQELEADGLAVCCGLANGLASALRRLCRNQLPRDPAINKLVSTHPTIGERLSNLHKLNRKFKALTKRSKN